MRKMQAEGLQHASIARVFGISRERIRQLLGNSGKGKEELRAKKKKELIEQFVNSPLGFGEICDALDISYQQGRIWLQEELGARRVKEIRIEKAMGVCEQKLVTWMKENPKAVITHWNLIRLGGDYALAAYVFRHKPPAQWRVIYGQPEHINKTNTVIKDGIQIG